MGTVGFYDQSCKFLTENILNENTVKQVCGDSVTKYLPVVAAALAVAVPVGFLGKRIYHSLTNTNLVQAATYGYLRAVKAAIARGENLDQKDPQTGDTVLCLAIQGGHHGVVKALLDGGASVTTVNLKGETPLHAAAKVNSPECLALLIAKGSDVNAKDGIGNTPLVNAASRGFVRNVNALLEADGVSVDEQNDKGETALNSAAAEHIEVVDALLEKRANANIPDVKGQIPLHKASDQENVDALRALLPVTGNCNHKDKDGNTALHLTVHHTASRLKSAEVLLAYPHVDPDQLNGEGESALHLACYKMTGDNKLALMMIKSKRFNLDLQTHSEDENIEAYRRNTAAHIALLSGDKDIVKALSEAGADFSTPNREGKIPLQMALEVTMHDCVPAMLGHLTKEQLETLRIDGLSLIDWATLQINPFVEAILNEKGIFFRFQPEDQERLIVKGIEICYKTHKKVFGTSPLKIKEFREIIEDYETFLANPKTNEELPEYIALLKKHIEHCLTRRATVARYKEENRHKLFVDLIGGTIFDFAWYGKAALDILPEELRALINKFNDQQPNPEMALALIPQQYRFLFEREISLSELREYLPLVKGLLNTQLPRVMGILRERGLAVGRGE